MCKNLIKVKSKNPYNIKYSYIPCGKCEECRKAVKTQWTTRLKAEIEYYHTNLNFNVGFLTLTYNDKHLPTIPKSFFKPDEYKKIPCFSYLDIRKFTDCIRTYLWREYHMKEGFRFFITCEYGEKKHRPHYHGIILFNSKISHEQMYKLCQDAWCGTTEIIPNNKKTPRKNHGFIGDLNSFVPRDNYACGAYVAKYVCKDIEFANTITGKFDHLSKKQKNHLRHFLQFHKQSMCFGSCIIKDKNDEELMEMFKNGIMFTGYDKMTKLPAYIKNKLLFTTHKKYNLNTHKHETIKSYTKFFYDHKAEIYDIKFKQNVKYLEQYGTKEYWQTHKYIDDATTVRDGYKTATEIIDSVGIGELSYFYTLYFGVPYEYCKWFKNPAEAIFARYNPCADLENLPLIDKDYYDYMSSALQYLMGNIHLIETVERSKEDELIDQIRAYFNN